MRPRSRLLLASMGAVLLAAGTAGAAWADPSPSPSDSPWPSASAGSSPSVGPAAPSRPAASTSPSASSSTSDSAGAESGTTAGTNDMSVSASDVTVEANGPGSYPADIGVAVRNNGTATQHGVTVTIVPPAGTTVTGAYEQDGIGGCAPATVNGRAGMTCRVHDGGPGHRESVRFHLTVRVPLPAGHSGRVFLAGIADPVAHPTDTSVDYDTYVEDASWPTQQIDLRSSATDPVLHLGSDGHYRGTVTVTVSNHSTKPVDSVALEIVPPQNVTLVGLASGAAGHCERISGDNDLRNLHFPTGLRCRIPVTHPGASGSYTFTLSAATPDTNGTVGTVDLVATEYGANLVEANPSRTAAQFRVTFAAGRASASATAAGGHAAGTGGLPVTGAPLGLLAGGAALALAGGTGLVLLARHRRSPHPAGRPL